MFCFSCGGECPSTTNFCHQCGQQLAVEQDSNEATSSVEKEKWLTEYFHRGYPYDAIVCLLGKRHGVRVHVRTLKRKLKELGSGLVDERVLVSSPVLCDPNTILKIAFLLENFVPLRTV